MDLINSNAFRTPPKPASASATIGASQLIRRTICGTEFTGYSDWSG
jgi:hypothetical protein